MGVELSIHKTVCKCKWLVLLYIKKMSGIKSPPVFHPEEDDDYTSWINDVSIWKMYTDTNEAKIGAAVYLSLKGKAREAENIETRGD